MTNTNDDQKAQSEKLRVMREALLCAFGLSNKYKRIDFSERLRVGKEALALSDN
jgi:hypothetical protein